MEAQPCRTTEQTRLVAANIQPKLRAERIQHKLRAEKIEQKLRAERIQGLASALPGWEVDRSRLERHYALPTVRAASLLAALINEMGEAVGFVPKLTQNQADLVVTVATDPDGRTNELDVDLARFFDHLL